jgi:hypothetical protein
VNAILGEGRGLKERKGRSAGQREVVHINGRVTI